jgi:PTS system galactitol-specific IIB component
VVEVPHLAPDAELVIATAQVPYDISVPVINGIPFLTGIGVEEVIDRIEQILRGTSTDVILQDSKKGE